MNPCDCSTVQNTVPQLSSGAITMLYNGLAAHEKYGPETFDRCLGRMPHTKKCVKKWSEEDKADFQRNVQTLFLRKVFAEDWARSYMPGLIEELPKESQQACEFLMKLPKKLHETSDNALLRKCAATEDSAFITNIFDIVLGIKEPQLVVEAYSTFPKKERIDKVVRIILLNRVGDVHQPDKDFPVAKALVAYIGKHLPKTCKKGWKAFANDSLQEENRRMVDQFKVEYMFHSAFSIKDKTIKEWEDGCPLYNHLEAFADASDHTAAWKEIPEELKTEYAYTFASLLMRMKFLAADKTALKAICDDFYTNSCKDLDEATRDSILMMLDGEKFLREVLQG